MFSAFIVDDEPIARDNLIDAIKNHKQWQIARTYSSGSQLIEDVERDSPDVVFLDIKMPGDSGLSLAKKLLAQPKPPLIVFVTAFSEYAIHAFELYAVDYLLKPFDDARIARCVDKLQQALTNQTLFNDKVAAQDAWANTKPLKQLVIKSSASIRIIPTDDIEWLAANGNYVDIHHQGTKHLLRGSLKTVLSYLPKSQFIQVHRGVAVRFSMIREIKTLDDERSILTLSNNLELPVGKSFKQRLVSELFETRDR